MTHQMRLSAIGHQLSAIGSRIVPVTAALTASLLLAGCDGSSPAAPSPGPGSGPIGATITITSSGVSPQEVTVAPGSRVMFVNNGNVAHEMSSDPHPTHTDCPALNLGLLQPGQSRATADLNTVRSCGFHDHLRDTDPSLRGTVHVQ